MNLKDFFNFAVKVIIVHFVTYLIAGLIFSNVFNYPAIFEMEIIKDYYISYSSHNIILGPLLQPIRGLLFAIAIYPLRDFLKKKKHGWLTLWLLIILIGIFSTPGAGPSSIEGMLYTKTPLWFHFIGLPETLSQTLAFSFLILYWDNKKTSKTKKIVTEIIKTTSIACFGYIGYATAAILMLLLNTLITTGTAVIDPEVISKGGNLTTQLMFIIAFIINIITIYFISKKYRLSKIKLWQAFILFFIIDVTVPWIYQLILMPPGPQIHFALILGLLPAIIITISIKYNYKISPNKK